VTPSAGLDPDGLVAVHDRLAPHVESGAVPAMAALVASGGDVHVEILGALTLGDPAPLPRTAIFRIASLTKPITAAATMALIDDGVLSLSDPVEPFLPELADRRVLRSLHGPLDDTVPAERSITVEDLLTCRLGFGCILEAAPGTFPVQQAEEELELRTLGPPWPPPQFGADEWLARFSTLPLLEQPGQAWRYNTGIHLLGFLVERVCGQRLGEHVRERFFEPLGMADTAFAVPDGAASRCTTAYAPNPATGALAVFDPAKDGWWHQRQPFDNGAGMLVSTLDDFWAFVSMIRNGGEYDGEQLLSKRSVAAMTSNHLTEGQRLSARLFLGQRGGWGYGMAAPGPVPARPPELWGYGWEGGLGSTWRSDPDRDLTCLLLTTRAMTSPEAPAHFTDFWDAADAAMRR
jgi:CubicO group peptidase (beta-lactamase class C family)